MNLLIYTHNAEELSANEIDPSTTVLRLDREGDISDARELDTILNKNVLTNITLVVPNREFNGLIRLISTNTLAIRLKNAISILSDKRKVHLLYTKSTGERLLYSVSIHIMPYKPGCRGERIVYNGVSGSSRPIKTFQQKMEEGFVKLAENGTYGIFKPETQEQLFTSTEKIKIPSIEIDTKGLVKF